MCSYAHSITLTDIEFVRTIKETIKKNKLQYASNIQLNNKSMF